MTHFFEILDSNQVPLVLRQLCAALTKIPDREEKINPELEKINPKTAIPLPTPNIVNNNCSASLEASSNKAPSLPKSQIESQPKANEGNENHQNSIDTAQEDVKSVLGKRRKSIQSDLETNSTVKCANSSNVLSSDALKKRRVDSNDNSSSTKNQTNSANYQHQGKITEYLPEKKDSDPFLKKEKFEKTISSTMTSVTAVSLESSTEKMNLGQIKTEPSVVGSTITEEDVDEDDEGALIIDDNASPCQEDDEEELRDSQKNCHNETLDEIVAHDTKPDTTENDLTNDLTINDSKSFDSVDSSKQTIKYSHNKVSAPDSKNTTSVDTSVSEQLPLEMLIKEEEDAKAMPSSPLAFSSSSSGISSSSSASLKDDTSSIISISRMSSSSSSGASSYTKDYDHLFEIPRAIRFPPPDSNGCSKNCRSQQQCSNSPFSGCISSLSRNSGISVSRLNRSDSTESGSNNNNLTETVICRWELCGQEFDSSGKLLDHLKTVHARIGYSSNKSNNNNAYEESEENDKDSINSQSSASCAQYKCLWEGCKVYGKGSSTKSWLEKHVVANHGGNKPFQCIVDDCKERFGTQKLLERHVNSHFKCKTNSGASTVTGENSSNQSSVQNPSSPLSTSVSSLNKNSISQQGNGHGRMYHSKLSRASKKLLAPNGKKLKYRKTIYSARIFDLFDLGVMAQVRQRITAFETGCKKLQSGGYVETPTVENIKPQAPKHKSKCKEKPTKKAKIVPAEKPTNSYGFLEQTIVFRSDVLAKRTDADGQVRVLLQWMPNGV